MRTMARDALRPDFRRIDTEKTRVILVEGGPRLLNTFPEELSERARLDLEQMGVDVRLNTLVTDVSSYAVTLGAEVLATRTVFWAAGNLASPLGAMLGAPTDRAGRVLVNEDLTVGDRANVYAVGDMAVMTRKDGRPVPGVCQGAIQSGHAAADNIVHTLRKQPRRAFRYFNKGDMATIGRRRAVADLGALHFGGTIAWLLWLFIHIMYLAGFRNRLVVFVTWAWEYLTYQKGVRLIIENDRDRGAQSAVKQGVPASGMRDASSRSSVGSARGDSDDAACRTCASGHTVQREFRTGARGVAALNIKRLGVQTAKQFLARRSRSRGEWQNHCQCHLVSIELLNYDASGLRGGRSIARR